MITFKNNNLTYIPSVDLTTLGNTFNTLEQGHKEAVKAASDLEITVANLPMNEDEDGFKQQLVNDIKNTIDENTIYGNSYGALDDLIIKIGNIKSDGRVIGRLRNQAAKKEYDAKVDAMPITEGMKQMYKEQNPYHYEDGEIDERTGRYLPGELWKPTTNPVATVPENEIQKYALQIAAKDAGSGETISFLDANGNPTSDPSKSEDGTMYKKVGSKWERLSADKIAKAYRVAINSIPGAKDSLNQDYRYEQWKYDKEVKKAEQNGGDTTPFIEGFTDKNGNIYTEDQWLNNKINGFSNVAAYNHTYSSVDWGTALSNRKARQEQAAAVAASTIVGDPNRGFGTMIVGTKEIEGNAFAGAEQAKAAANAQGLGIVKRLLGDKAKGMDSLSDVMAFIKRKDGSFGPNIAAQDIIKQYGKDMSDEDKIKLINAFNGYYRANAQIKQMINAAGSEADGIRFNSNIANQEFTNDNKYGKKIIERLNSYFKNRKEAKWQVGSQIMDGIASKYGTTIDGLRKMGMSISMRDDGNYDVSIDANNRMLIPKFATTIREVNNEIPGTIGGWFKNKFTTGVSSTNYYEYGIGGQMNDVGTHRSTWSSLVDIYKNGLESSKKANKKAAVAKGTITYNGLDDGSFTSLWLRENGKTLGYTDAELRAQQDAANERVDAMFANGLFDAGQIEYIDANGRTTKDIAANQDAKTIIQKMYRNNTWRSQIKRSCIVPYGGTAGQPLGYAVGFTVPKGAGTGIFKEGKTYTFVVSGIAKEEIDYNPSANPNILAGNVMLTSRATGSAIENLGYNTDLGDTRIIPTKDGKYNTTMFGNTKTLDENEATSLTSLMYTLDNMKAQYQSGMFTGDMNRLIQLENNIKTISANIAAITGKHASDIEMSIGNYILNVE